MFMHSTTFLAFMLIASGVEAKITADSKAGERLLSKARKLNDNNNYLNFVKDYSIKFEGCSSIPQFEADEDEGVVGFRNMLMARFKLCPSDNGCDKCENAGEYVVEMSDFVQAQQQASMTYAEYNCEITQENCEYKCENGMYDMTDANNYYYYNGDDGNYCTNVCVSAAGMGDCLAEDEEEEVDYEELFECNQVGDNENNNNNNNYYAQASYYVGAHCVDGGVYLNTFSDASCTAVASEGASTFYAQNGYYLPTKNLITDDCVSCKEPNNEENQNDYYYNQDAVMEVCEELYQASGKCEDGMSGVVYPDNSACNLIRTTLPQLDGLTSSKGSGKFAAWFFFLTTLAGCAYIVRMKKKLSGMD